MKKFTKSLFRVLFLAVISMSLLVNTGCEKDEDSLDSIVGTWVFHEAEVTYGVITMTMTPAEMQMSISVVFHEDLTYTATIVEEGVTDIETGTWVRTNSSTVTITAITNNDGPMTLTKDGEYYVGTYTEDSMVMKMKFKKQ
jgi:hypothetical protein